MYRLEGEACQIAQCKGHYGDYAKKMFDKLLKANGHIDKLIMGMASASMQKAAAGVKAPQT